MNDIDESEKLETIIKLLERIAVALEAQWI